MEGRRFPPEYWFEYWSRRKRSGESPSFRLLSKAGYDRVTSAPFPMIGPVGLDVIDPILYDALVADELARLVPNRIGVQGDCKVGSCGWVLGVCAGGWGGRGVG
jgi:hypothetical protein